VITVSRIVLNGKFQIGDVPRLWKFGRNVNIRDISGRSRIRVAVARILNL